MKVEVSPSDIETAPTDERGRLTLGTKYKNANVTVAVLEVEQNDE